MISINILQICAISKILGNDFVYLINRLTYCNFFNYCKWEFIGSNSINNCFNHKTGFSCQQISKTLSS